MKMNIASLHNRVQRTIHKTVFVSKRDSLFKKTIFNVQLNKFIFQIFLKRSNRR